MVRSRALTPKGPWPLVLGFVLFRHIISRRRARRPCIPITFVRFLGCLRHPPSSVSFQLPGNFCSIPGSGSRSSCPSCPSRRVARLPCLSFPFFCFYPVAYGDRLGFETADLGIRPGVALILPEELLPPGQARPVIAGSFNPGVSVCCIFSSCYPCHGPRIALHIKVSLGLRGSLVRLASCRKHVEQRT